MKRIPLLLIALASCAAAQHRGPSEPADSGWKWTADRANAWYAAQPWLVGVNFIPSTADNELEFWQKDTFDPATIDRELGWAADVGYNIVRVFLHNIAWEEDGDAFLGRMDRFLAIADKHHIKVLFVLFDDCWNPNAKPGKQPDPIPGVHNSRWLQAPGIEFVDNPSSWPRFEKYAKAVLKRFGNDQRVLFWDLYNEPGNSNNGAKSVPFLKAVFRWARDIEPSQPVSVDVWGAVPEVDEYAWKNSDIITAHEYADHATTEQMARDMKLSGRPVIFTEWMARTRNSTIPEILPVFRRFNEGSISWGFVAGRTNTIFPWNSPEGSPEPKVWFHEILRRNGTAYDPNEIAVIQKLTGRGVAGFGSSPSQ